MTPLNVQPQEKLFFDSQGFLDVVDIFPTIQGEGPHAGCPAVFVRLAGCNLQCTLCDTDYTSKRVITSPLHLIDKINAINAESNFNLVVITGGEPFRQNLGPLIQGLTAVDYDVQVETNGTLHQNMFPFLTKTGQIFKYSVVVSPKTPKIHHAWGEDVEAFKYVVQAGRIDKDGFPTSVLGVPMKVARPPDNFFGQIYIQPCDEGDVEKNKLNTQAAVEVCLKHNRRLCVQVHKIVDLP